MPWAYLQQRNQWHTKLRLHTDMWSTFNCKIACCILKNPPHSNPVWTLQHLDVARMHWRGLKPGAITHKTPNQANQRIVEIFQSSAVGWAHCGANFQATNQCSTAMEIKRYNKLKLSCSASNLISTIKEHTDSRWNRILYGRSIWLIVLFSWNSSNNNRKRW